MSILLYDTWPETKFHYCQPYKIIYKFTVDLNPDDSKNLFKSDTSQKKDPF